MQVELCQIHTQRLGLLRSMEAMPKASKLGVPATAQVNLSGALHDEQVGMQLVDL